MYFITEKGYEIMVDAYGKSIARAEMIVGGNTYDAEIIRITKVDYKTLKILVRGELGEGNVTSVRIYNKDGEMIADLLRDMDKPIDQHVYTTLLFDLFPTNHPVGPSLAGIGEVK